MKRKYPVLITLVLLPVLFACKGPPGSGDDGLSRWDAFPLDDPLADEDSGLEFVIPGDHVAAGSPLRITDHNRLWTLHYKGEKPFIANLAWSNTEPWGGEPIEEDRDSVMADHLRRTAALRTSRAHPEWADLTVDDLEVTCLKRLEARNRYLFVEMTYARYTSRGGLDVTALWETETGVLRFYRRHDVHEAIVAELTTGEWESPKLTPAEAIEKAEAHVGALLGGFPDDVRPAVMGFHEPSDPAWQDSGWPEVVVDWSGVWLVSFERCAGAMSYPNREGVKVHFCERHGVSFYADYRFSEPWEGRALINQTEAIEKARDFFDAVSYTHLRAHET